MENFDLSKMFENGIDAGGGVDNVMKGGGLAGVLTFFLKMVTDFAKSCDADGEWSAIIGPFSKSLRELFSQTGGQPSESMKTNLHLIENRGTAAMMDASVHKRIAEEIVQNAPDGSQDQLADLVEHHSARAQDVMDKMNRGSRDKYGFDESFSPTLSLDDLDRIMEVNSVGIVMPRTVQAIKDTKSRSL